MTRLLLATAIALALAWRMFPSNPSILNLVACLSAGLAALTLAGLHRTSIELHQFVRPCMPERAPVVVRA